MRYDVYLVKGRASYFSKSYKLESAAVAATERLEKKYGYLGYTTRIDTIEKERPKRQKTSVFESYQE